MRKHLSSLSFTEKIKVLEKLRDRGKTIFVVTHQAEILKTIADESVTLQDGRLVARVQSITNAPREVTR